MMMLHLLQFLFDRGFGCWYGYFCVFVFVLVSFLACAERARLALHTDTHERATKKV